MFSIHSFTLSLKMSLILSPVEITLFLITKCFMRETLEKSASDKSMFIILMLDFKSSHPRPKRTPMLTDNMI